MIKLCKKTHRHKYKHKQTNKQTNLVIFSFPGQTLLLLQLPVFEWIFFFFGEQREKKHSFWKHIHFHIWRKILSVLFQLYLAVNHREKFSKNLYVYILFVIWPPYVDYILSGRSVFTSGKEFFFYFLVKIQKKKKISHLLFVHQADDSVHLVLFLRNLDP